MTCICTVSSVNGEKTAADIAIPEREDMVITGVPFLNLRSSELPVAGDMVVAIFEDSEQEIGIGFILGVIQQGGNNG